MRKIISVFGLLTIIFGCEKDEINYNFPITLISTEYKIISELKLFTKTGQIMDNLIIDKYLASNRLGYFYSRIDTNLQLGAPDTIIYEYQDTVLFSEPGLWGKRIPKNNGNYIYFYLTDTLIGNKTMQQESELKDIINQIGIQKPYFEDYGPSTGLPPFTRFQRVFDAKIAKGSPNKLEFPLLTYLLSRTKDNYRTGFGIKNYNNVFDSNVINLLESGDTLAIQEAKIIYTSL
jgi:hypothetical protein